MTTKTRIDMKHGFMQCIIRNQVDRDKYDKQVKAKAEDYVLKTNGASARPKKPNLQTYIPPGSRKQQTCDSDNRVHLFRFEYEDENGEIHQMDIYKDDDPGCISQTFGHELGLSLPMMLALSDFLTMEMKRRVEAEET